MHRGKQTGRSVMLAHGFGCDQNMWRLVAPALRGRYRMVLFDHVGAGRSDLSAWTRERYSVAARATPTTCWRSAASWTCTSGVRRALGQRDDRGAGRDRGSRRGSQSWSCSPRRRATSTTATTGGGFSRADIDELLESLDSNYLGWSAAMAPVIMGNPDRPELGEELTNSFCRTDPAIARRFARATFLSDNRADLPRSACRRWSSSAPRT